MRNIGETVGSYNITNANFGNLTGTAAGNYQAPTLTGTPKLSINKANLTASIADQTKTYGQDDPNLNGIAVNLSGLINRNVATWNGTVAINDAGAVGTTLTLLIRNVGETVGSYNITNATFGNLTGIAAGNYQAPTFTGTPKLSINKANLTASIADQTKNYGQNDPSDAFEKARVQT